MKALGKALRDTTKMARQKETNSNDSQQLIRKLTDPRKKIHGGRTWENGISASLEALEFGIKIMPQPLNAQCLSGGNCRLLVQTLYF